MMLAFIYLLLFLSCGNLIVLDTRGKLGTIVGFGMATSQWRLAVGTRYLPMVGRLGITFK